MTTVGYGDVVAVSPFGRIISIINALWGAFVISLLVGSISGILNLNDAQKKAVCEITSSQQAAASIQCSIQYFNAKNDHKKNKDIPKENQTDYVPSKYELNDIKNKMIEQVDLFRKERKQNEDIIPSIN